MLLLNIIMITSLNSVTAAYKGPRCMVVVVPPLKTRPGCRRWRG